MAEDRKAIALQNQEIKNLATQPFTLEAKAQRPSQFKMPIFLPRRRTLEGSLGRTGIETQTMVERPSINLHKTIKHWQDLGR